MILVIGGSYQGKTEYVKKMFENHDEIQILHSYHTIVKQQLLEGKDPMEEAKKMLESNENLVIISDEIGYGLVPLDPFERRYREVDGRVNCYLATQAEQVIRVICGVGNRIK